MERPRLLFLAHCLLALDPSRADGETPNVAVPGYSKDYYDTSSDVAQAGVDPNQATSYVHYAPGMGGATQDMGVSSGSAPAFTVRQSSRRLAPVAGKNLMVADFNGDGRSDWLDVKSTGETTLGFGAELVYQWDDGPQFEQDLSQLVACDFDGDGKDDFIVIDEYGSHQLALSRGDGTFEVADRVEGLDGYGVCPLGCSNVRVADVNSDGRCDLYNIQADGNHAIFLSLGKNANGELAFGVINPVLFDDGAGAHPSEVGGGGASGAAALHNFSAATGTILAADFDGDNRTDWLRLDAAGEHQLLLSRHFPQHDGKRRPGSAAAGRAVSGGPGHFDVLPNFVARKARSGIGGLHGYSVTNADSVGSERLCGAGEGCAHVLALDFNGDGRSDVVVLQADGNHALFESQGTGQGALSFKRHAPLWSLENFTFAADSADAQGLASQVVVGDFNGDGYDDLLLFDGGAQAGDGHWGQTERLGGWNYQGGHKLATSNGDGTFKTFPTVPGLPADYVLPGRNRTTAGGGGYSLRVGDWDGDGMADFAAFQTDGRHLLARNAGPRVAVPSAYSNSRFARYGDPGYRKDYYGSGSHFDDTRYGQYGSALNTMASTPGFNSEFPSATQGTGR
jgi:hypothetical protein